MLWDFFFSNFHISTSIGTAIVLVMFMWVFLGETVSDQTPWSSDSYNLSATLSAMLPEPKIHWDWGPIIC